MKLSTLKSETYDAWECVNTFNDAVVQPEHFKAEVRTFGDLRRKETWKKAYCSFWAQNIYDSCLDAYNLIRIYFNPSPDDWNYELRYRIFEEFLKFPDGLELIKLGLEQLFSANFTSQERKKADGFFELVQGQSEGGEEFGGAVSSIRRFAELAGTSPS